LIRADIDAVTNQKTDFTLHHGAQSYRIETTLLGRHNVYNTMASFGAAAALGVRPDAILGGIASLTSVPGRLMPVPNQKGLSVFIDYAHTDDALKNVLTAVREFTRGRVIVVFGCGGNRDRGKRPLMGRVATELADFAFVTSDNPRNEAPEAIIKDIVRGLDKNNYQTVPGRRDAICAAIETARPQDSVVIAGKGHENYQIVKDQVNHFDDFEVAQQCLS
jgi:UDP-N-acetylmuramyl-tripeptide synthetase